MKTYHFNQRGKTMATENQKRIREILDTARFHLALIQADIQADLIEVEKALKELSVETKQKKTRGRPKKAKVIVEKVKRGRGRPRKQITKE